MCWNSKQIQLLNSNIVFLNQELFQLNNLNQNLLSDLVNLQTLLDNPFRPFDISIDTGLGIGTSINANINARLYLYNGLNLFLSIDGIYSQYMINFNSYPYLLATAGISYNFYWRY